MNPEQQYHDYLAAWAEPAIHDWFRRQSANPHAHMYLFYKRKGGGLYIGEDPPNSDWHLATNERVSPAWTPQQVHHFIADTCRRLPIY